MKERERESRGNTWENTQERGWKNVTRETFVVQCYRRSTRYNNQRNVYLTLSLFWSRMFNFFEISFPLIVNGYCTIWTCQTYHYACSTKETFRWDFLVILKHLLPSLLRVDCGRSAVSKGLSSQWIQNKHVTAVKRKDA